MSRGLPGTAARPRPERGWRRSRSDWRCWRAWSASTAASIADVLAHAERCRRRCEELIGAESDARGGRRPSCRLRIDERDALAERLTRARTKAAHGSRARCASGWRSWRWPTRGSRSRSRRGRAAAGRAAPTRSRCRSPPTPARHPLAPLREAASGRRALTGDARAAERRPWQCAGEAILPARGAAGVRRDRRRDRRATPRGPSASTCARSPTAGRCSASPTCRRWRRSAERHFTIVKDSRGATGAYDRHRARGRRRRRRAGADARGRLRRTRAPPIMRVSF